MAGGGEKPQEKNCKTLKTTKRESITNYLQDKKQQNCNGYLKPNTTPMAQLADSK